MGKWTRRAFIGTGTLVGGGFVLGVAGVVLSPSRHSVVSDDAADTGELNTWILVTPDNLVTVLVPHCEMGQGSQTALAMMAAEEMEADWNLVRVKEAPALDAYANAYMAACVHRRCRFLPRSCARSTTAPIVWPVGTALQATGGSTAVRGTGRYGMTVAGAAAREMLIAAAAERFGVSPDGVQGQQLARRRTRRPDDPPASESWRRRRRRTPFPPTRCLKHPDTYTIRRTARPRFDIPLQGRTAARSTASTSRCRACCMPPSTSRRSTAASWCRWTRRRPRRCRA